MEIKKIVNFIFELNELKRLEHSGFKYIGVKNPCTVAEHVMRATQIAYILAIMEKNKNPEKIVTMVAIHDNGETRIGDQNKIGARYYSDKEAEQKSFDDQLKNLGMEIERKWKQYFKEFETRTTEEGVIAKDADWLEVAFQAKEYLDLGHKEAKDWIDSVEKALETKSAKRILKQMKKTEFTDWWQGLKKMTYKKLKPKK